MGGGGITRDDTTNSRGRREANAPEKKRGMTRGVGVMRGGQMEVPPDGRRRRTRDNTTTSRGRQEA
jgi:hypothetical protein